ncbi:MAG: hypothetical protein AB7T38_02595 [Nitrospirales bacterium]
MAFKPGGDIRPTRAHSRMGGEREAIPHGSPAGIGLTMTEAVPVRISRHIVGTEPESNRRRSTIGVSVVTPRFTETLSPNHTHLGDYTRTVSLLPGVPR